MSNLSSNQHHEICASVLSGGEEPCNCMHPKVVVIRSATGEHVAFSDYLSLEAERDRLRSLVRGMLVECDEGMPAKAAWLARRTGEFSDDPSVHETPTELQRAKELVAWLPITTEELIRLRNANKITFDKQVNSITTVLIQLRELFADSPVETSACDCPEVCKVCGGRAKACALLGHRPEGERYVKWHKCAPKDEVEEPPELL